MEVEVLRRELEVVKRGDDVVGPDVKETQRRQPKAKYPAYFPENGPMVHKIKRQSLDKQPLKIQVKS